MNLISVFPGVLYFAVSFTVASPQSTSPVSRGGSSAGSAQAATYTVKYDNINLDEILASPRLVKSYVTCLVAGRPCTPEGNELKRILPDALKTSCAKCTDKQKQGAYKVINKLQKDYNEDYKKLAAKWDPTGEYFKKLQDAIKN